MVVDENKEKKLDCSQIIFTTTVVERFSESPG
jgi:hypothetical protein